MEIAIEWLCGLDSLGLSGGLALYWDETLNVSILDSCQCFIDVLVENNSNNTRWRATFVYGEPRVENRYRMWNNLNDPRAISHDPWLVCGDFNEAL